MGGTKGKANARPPPCSQGPANKDASATSGNVGRKVAALWGKMQEAPQRVMASVKGCISGSQAGAVIEWDGSKALAPVVCGDAPADHRHHQQQQHQEGQTHNSAAPTPVSSRPHTPGCPGVAGDRETLQDLHMRLEAPVGQEAVLVTQQVSQPVAPEGSMAAAAPADASRIIRATSPVPMTVLEAPGPEELAVASPLPQDALLGAANFHCTGVETLPLARCSASSPRPVFATTAATSGSPDISPSSAAGQGQATGSVCCEERALAGSKAVVAGTNNDAGKATALEVCSPMGHCTAHQQQLLMGARAISHQLSVQLARERTLSKQLLTAAMAQADTAAAYLQQVSLLQQAGLVREGGGATLVAEGQAVRQGAIAVEIDGEVAAIAAQLTLLKQQLQRFNCAEEVLSQMEGERNAAQQQVQELSAQLQQQTSSAEQGVSGFVRSLSELMNQKDSAQLQVQQLSAELQQQASCAAQALSGVMAERDSSQQQVQQLQQQVSSAEQVVGRVITERDTAQLQVQQLSAELQQQQASSSEELSKVLRERDAAQLQVQQLSTQLQQVQGQLTNCQQELVEVRAAVPSPEQLQQYYQYYQGYQALCAAYQEQAAQLQGATSERDGLSQQLGQTQQQLQQVTGERDSFAQQLQVITTERDSNQQQLVEVQQQLAACQAEKRRLEVFERQLGRVEEQLGRAEAELVQEKEHRDKEREKGEMLVSALNQVLATAAPGQVVGVGSLGPRVGAGAQGEVKQVWLDLALHGGVTTQQALAQGLTPPRSADDWWGEPTVMKLGDAAKCAQEVAITAVATLKGAANGVYLGPKLRYVELGGVGQKPQLYLEMWSCDLWQLLTHARLVFKQRLFLVEGMALSVHRMHTVLRVVHFNIKPENYLIRQLEDGNYEGCPADYGFSCDAISLAEAQRRAGGPYIICSPGYTSPAIGALSTAVRRLAFEPEQWEVCAPLEQMLDSPPEDLTFEDGEKCDNTSLCISMTEAILVTPGDPRSLADRWDLYALSPLTKDDMSKEVLKKRHNAAARLLDLWGDQVSVSNLMEGVVGHLGAAAAAQEGVMDKAERLCQLLIGGMQSLGEVDLLEVAAAARELRGAPVRWCH